MDGPRDYHVNITLLSEVSQEENDKYHMLAHMYNLKRDAWSQERGFPDSYGRHGAGGTNTAPGAEPLGPARPQVSAWNWQIISAGWVQDAGGAFGKRERAEEKRSFQARAQALQLTALKKHHENEISHHTKEIECLQREIERHKRSIKKLKHRDDSDQVHTVLHRMATYYCPLLCRHSSGLTSIRVLPANYNRSSSVKRNKIKHDTNEHIFETENRLTDIENRLMVPSRGRAGKGRMGSLGFEDTNCYL